MQWSSEAEEAVKKVPLFIQKRVRARVEKEATDEGKDTITLADVKATQAKATQANAIQAKATQERFLRKKKHEIKGYQLDRCFGSPGCPNRAIISDDLFEKIDTIFQESDLLQFLKGSVTGGLKFHHEFRLSLADCPNACSQPQIKDIGIIGAAGPSITDSECTECEACVAACKEGAVKLLKNGDGPVIDRRRCLYCAQCMAVCPTGTLAKGEIGYRVQLGGKLGRHPQLARELPGIFTEAEVLEIIRRCISLYKQRSVGGTRFAEILTDGDFIRLAR